MKLRISAAAFVFLLAVPFAFAGDMKMGADVTPNGGDLAPAATRTDISLEPATAAGVISSVKVYWSNAACANAFSIQFFRRIGDLIKPTAERGPFTTTSNVMTVEMKPAVSVGQGDLIGIVRIGDCGSPGTFSGTPSAGYLSFEGAVNTNRTVIDGQRVNSALAIFASGPATNAVTAVLPAVGSVKGVFGSSFRTSLQLLNPSTSAMTGSLIFNPQASGPGGISYPYSIPAGQQVSVDLAFALTGTPFNTTGIGSIDVNVPAGQGTPQIIARVYNDAGAGGTAGFYEDPIALTDSGPGGHVITMGASAFMVSPVDPSRTRFNIGVRTLFSGAELTAELLDSSGHVLASAAKRYPAGYFEQVDAASFFGGVPVGANRTIKITVDDGSAIVYGATTDNVTNDPSLQYAIVGPATE